MLLPSLLLLMQTSPQVAAPLKSDSDHNININVKVDAAFLAAADKNGDGALDMKEFKAELDRRLADSLSANHYTQKDFGSDKRAQLEKGFEAVFRAGDINSDGMLTSDEVKALSNKNKSA